MTEVKSVQIQKQKPIMMLKKFYPSVWRNVEIKPLERVGRILSFVHVEIEIEIEGEVRNLCFVIAVDALAGLTMWLIALNDQSVAS